MDIQKIIREEIQGFIEGVGDKYAENKFGIADPDKTYMQQTQAAIKNSDNGELVGYTRLGYDYNSKKTDPNSPVFKNPKSLKNFEKFVRAFSDDKGNLYVGLINGDYTHDNMGNAVGIGGYAKIYDLKYGLTWNRVGTTNKFGLSDSDLWYADDDQDDDVKELFNLRLQAVRLRNPAFEFVAEIYYNLNEDGYQQNVDTQQSTDAMIINNISVGMKEGDDLNENVSDIVYHYTYTPYLINILETNKFVTSSNLGGTADAKYDKGRFFFFSTQRTKGKSGYASKTGTNVGIVLDGRALNQNYKGFPMDYWQYSKKRSDWDDDSGYQQALGSSELEDRVVTNKPYIDNASKYILEIHVFVNINHFVKPTLVDIESKATKYDIPIYFYTDLNDFQLQNKAKAVQVEQIDVAEKSDDYNREEREKINSSMLYDFEQIAPLLLYKNDKMNADVMQVLRQSIGVDEKSDDGKLALYQNISKKINDKLKRYDYRNEYDEDMYKYLKSMIKNNRGNANPEFRTLLKYLVDDMRSRKTTDLRKYFQSKFNSGMEEKNRLQGITNSSRNK